MRLKYLNKNDEDMLSYENLSPEDKKLFLLTKFNTNLNREMLADQEVFIKKGIDYLYDYIILCIVYSQIYGLKGSNEIFKSFPSKLSPKKKKTMTVKFNDIPEISRN